MRAKFVALILGLATPALAQQADPVQIINGGTPVSNSNPLPVSASVSASISGFTPSASGARMTPLAVTTADSSGPLPTGTEVVVSNPGANPMYCNVNGVAATISDQPIAAGAGNWFAFTIPSGVTTLHCIATGGSTTANGVGGSGLPTGAGGGGGGSSSNASVSATGSAVPASATYVGIISGGNLVGWNGAITGTVTANLGTLNGAATAALQTSGNTTLSSILTAVQGPIPTQAPTVDIGATGISQTTFGTTNGVVSAASRYQAVAASQTATVLQSSTGATGDYLSHCVIYPASTSPGVVTVFDNTNTAANSAVLFAGGSSSTSNLTPITVPVGAKSLNGPWKVTTGANVSAVCYGKFS